ncbi:MAG: tripartite tricarboxylate transporter TctB family protein [Syntrophales bacterium]|jgi:hypothetical protein|nr:tripartite tricarboxylate transporter TctB family protein [Syntrophales bacterium]
MEQKQREDRLQRGLSYNAVEAITAVVVFCIGAVMMFDTYRLGAGWAFDGPESGYFPFRIGAIASLASVVIFLRTLFAKKRNFEVFVSGDKLKLVLKVLVPAIIYVLATQLVGIYVASTLFIGGFMRMTDKSHWLKVFLVSILTSVILFWMFEIQFMVPLPKGPLEALFGY